MCWGELSSGVHNADTDSTPKNHDLDLGIAQFEHLTSQCKFPWLLANVLDPALGDDISLGHAEKTEIITSSNGIKIGLIGLAEKEWLEAVNALPPNIIYIDSPTAARQLVPELRARGADIIIALCHQREVHDNRLAEETPRGLIDIILGGHDHHYRHSKIKDTQVLCSGSDFKQLSYIEVRRRHTAVAASSSNAKPWDFTIVRRDIVSTVPEDAATLELMDRLFTSLKVKLKKPIGYTAVPLDSRFTTVRTRESNLGNFVSDLMRYYYDADCGIMVGGTIRGDVIYPPGVLRLKDVMDWYISHIDIFQSPLTANQQLSIRGSYCSSPSQGRSNLASTGEWGLPLSCTRWYVVSCTAIRRIT